MVTIPEITLIDDDGIPIENQYHRHQQQLLMESLHHHWRDRVDFFAGANMFVYFSRRQAENILRGDTKEYRGPDFFVVLGVDFHKRRTCWRKEAFNLNSNHAKEMRGIRPCSVE